MSKPEETAPRTEEGFPLKFQPRPSLTISLSLPADTIRSLEKNAAAKDMTREALLKFYIGQGLRQDLSKLFGDRVMEKTAQVLTRHIQSEAEVSAILNEIRGETVG